MDKAREVRVESTMEEEREMEAEASSLLELEGLAGPRLVMAMLLVLVTFLTGLGTSRTSSSELLPMKMMLPTCRWSGRP